MSHLLAIQDRHLEKPPRMFKCGGCGRLFEERSRHCPFCDTKSMGELKPIRGEDAERGRRRELERLRRKYR